MNISERTATAMLSHATEELAYVLSGTGELRRDDAGLLVGR